MGVGKAFGRFFRNLLSVLSLGLVKASRPMESNPQMVGREYDEVIEEKARAAGRIKDSVGALMARLTESERALQQLTAQVEELEQAKAGAAALAREHVEKLRAEGRSEEEIMQDGELLQLQAAFTDAGSSVDEKTERARDLEQQMRSLQESVERYVVEAQNLTREVERLQAEKHEVVASMEAARQLEQMNDTLAGLNPDATDNRLAKLRSRRAEAEGRAKAASVIADTEGKAQRDKLKAAARRQVQNAQFMEALGMDRGAEEQAEKAPAEEAADEPKPEDEEPRLPE